MESKTTHPSEAFLTDQGLPQSAIFLSTKTCFWLDMALLTAENFFESGRIEMFFF